MAAGTGNQAHVQVTRSLPAATIQREGVNLKSAGRFNLKSAGRQMKMKLEAVTYAAVQVAGDITHSIKYKVDTDTAGSQADSRPACVSVGPGTPMFSDYNVLAYRTYRHTSYLLSHRLGGGRSGGSSPWPFSDSASPPSTAST